ncbi:hypothetical protein F2Q69_00005576 [Brassica cretica]|uniref:Uncharacterized protein n=1 Tax=Brassica cretica TaxID=69181 RepID=A0A8S9PCR4_BRACR|nr:hypothetical protein F2Q69_00005576 [Brassica cretica]
MYIVNENNVPISTMVVRGEGWNKWVRELDSPDEPTNAVCATQSDLTTGPSRTIDLTKHCKYHDVKGHDTTECKSLYAHYLLSLASGDFKFEPLKAKPKFELQIRASKSFKFEPLKIKKEEPSARRPAKAEKTKRSSKTKIRLQRMTLKTTLLLTKNTRQTAGEYNSDDTDLRLTLNARKSQRVLTSGPVLKERPKGSDSDLRDKLNANMCDLRVLLNRSKPTDLRLQLERTKTPCNSRLPQNDDDAPTDLRAFLNSKRVNSRPRLNVIMGGSPPCGNSVRFIKDYHRNAATS